MSPCILENCVNFSPLLFGGFRQKPTFEKIFEACTDNFLEKSPKKVGKSPVLKTKSGQKNSKSFSENGTFLAFFALKCPIYDDLKFFLRKKPTFPLLFLI